MSNQCCVCSGIFEGQRQSIQISDGKTQVNLIGHASCINKLFDEIKNIPNLSKLPVDEVMKKLNIIQIN